MVFIKALINAFYLFYCDPDEWLRQRPDETFEEFLERTL